MKFINPISSQNLEEKLFDSPMNQKQLARSLLRQVLLIGSGGVRLPEQICTAQKHMLHENQGPAH